MSGTSMDGIDAAYLKTDGKRKVELGESISLPFNQNLRQKLKDANPEKDYIRSIYGIGYSFE